MIIGIATSLLAIAGVSSRADDDDFDPAPLIPVLVKIHVSLGQGLRAIYPHGWPVSAKYEIENGALRLSVDTVRDDRFSHVIVDYRSGAAIKADPIRDRENLADARNHSPAMAAAKVPLVTAVQDAEMASGGYRAVRIAPILIAGVAPVAVIALIKSHDVKEVSVKLDWPGGSGGGNVSAAAA